MAYATAAPLALDLLKAGAPGSTALFSDRQSRHLSPADFVINDAGPHAGASCSGRLTKWIGRVRKTFSRLAGSSAPRSLWAEEIAILKRVLLRLTGGPTVEEFHNEPQSEDLND